MNEQAGPPAAPDPLSHPESVGPYRVLGVLAHGGMGMVYTAEQTEPVRRRVALKVIKAGMDTREVVARFEAERQALALLDHPGIARMHEAGATEDGRPYFVMEYVSKRNRRTDTPKRTGKGTGHIKSTPQSFLPRCLSANLSGRRKRLWLGT